MNLDPRSTPQGWIYYDAQCRWCTRWVRRMGPVWIRRGFQFEPLQSARARAALAGSAAAADELKVRTSDGRIYGGADALAHLCRAVWWLWACGWLMSLPGIRSLARWMYRQVACRRPTGSCMRPPALSG
ncbi:thiol-disulfide oxidoreductase DCC family protein [Limisphaera sp. VF-2]|uniref:thiol-disulfide oxidoreductase DCC family protein n=1 Tax=Limisphaera sp. VF-2 TaxID=3400418 RepID=UPI0017643C6E|nr:DUF393 domain-containing protein [Limisphaera sp.]